MDLELQDLPNKNGNENWKKKFAEKGLIFLSGSIERENAESICREIIEINMEGKHNFIQMMINSPGGSFDAGFSIIDLMEWSDIPIYTTGIGLVSSMALLIFMTGKRGRRVLTKNTSILSHRFWTIQFGNHAQLLAVRKQQDIQHNRIVQHYIDHIKIKDKDKLEQTILRDVDTWLTPQEALEYGIADIIEGVN